MSFYDYCSNIYINIGICVIIFIISLALVIFAPKSKNYYSEEFPVIKYLYKTNNDIFIDDLELIKKENDWLKWPDKKNVVNNYLIYPLYIFSMYSYKRCLLCSKTLNILNAMGNIKTISYLKISNNSLIKKSKKWKDVSNDTLCCLIILDAPYVNKEEDCCIWVNGEIKPIIKNKLIIYDSSKMNSIINKSNNNVYALMIDIKKSNKLIPGSSDVKYNKDVYKFINNLNKENNLMINNIM